MLLLVPVLQLKVQFVSEASFGELKSRFLEKNVISASVGCSTNWAPEMGTWLNVEPEVSEKL